jgi:hypothetical protein
MNMKKADINHLANLIKSNGDITSIRILITPDKLTGEARVNTLDFRDENNFSILHLAAQHNRADVIKLVFELYPTLRVFQFYPLAYLLYKCQLPLHVAASNDFAECIDALIEHKANVNEVNDKKYTPLQIAIKENKKKAAEKLLQVELKEEIIIKDKNVGDYVFDLAIEKDNPILFRNLCIVYTPTREQLECATGKIKRLLDYQPAKRRKTRQEFSNVLSYYTNAEITIDKNKLFDDAANTSDDESSDSENDEYQPIRPGIKTTDNDYYYRSVYFHKDYFKTSKERREARHKKYHDRPIYSYAVKKYAEEKLAKKDGDFDYEKTEKLFRDHFESLKKMPDQQERQANGRKAKKRRDFDSLYHHLIQAYKNSYNELFNCGGLSRNFGFKANHNPFVSTSKNAIRAAGYATRPALTCITHVENQPLKLRRSTGRFKHRRFGYLLVFLIDKKHVEQHSADIDALQASKKIGTNHFYQYDEEVAFVASIPAQYLVGFQVLSFPSFNQKWSREIEKYFGLNKNQYDFYKKKFLEGDIFKELPTLIQQITAHQINLYSKRLFKNSTLQIEETDKGNASLTTPESKQPTNDDSINTISALLNEMGIKDQEESNLSEATANSLLETASNVNNETKQLKTEADKFGFLCHDVSRNGLCLLYAIEHQLNQLHQADKNIPTFSYKTLQEKLVDHLNNYYSNYSFQKTKNEIISQALNYQKDWASEVGDVACMALSRALNINIVIISSLGNIIVHKHHNPKTTIYLGHEHQKHYQSLIRNQYPSSPPEQSISDHIENSPVDETWAKISPSVEENSSSEEKDYEFQQNDIGLQPPRAVRQPNFFQPTNEANGNNVEERKEKNQEKTNNAFRQQN